MVSRGDTDIEIHVRDGEKSWLVGCLAAWLAGWSIVRLFGCVIG
jgi:hypothetical protein